MGRSTGSPRLSSHPSWQRFPSPTSTACLAVQISSAQSSGVAAGTLSVVRSSGSGKDKQCVSRMLFCAHSTSLSICANMLASPCCLARCRRDINTEKLYFLGMGFRKDKRTADRSAAKTTAKKPKVAGPNPFKRQAGADDGERKKRWRSIKQLL